MFTKFSFRVAALCCAFLWSAHNAYAAVATVEAMSFGTMVSTNNNAQYDITVNTDNSYTVDSSGFIVITPPQRGVYDIDSLPANRAILSVDVTQGGPLSFPGEQQMSLVDFQETHPATTDAFGVARITIGATARTNGVGSGYPDRTYSGVIRIEINLAP